MSFATLNGDTQRQPGLTLSLLAAHITLALLPSTNLAAPVEETATVEGFVPSTSSEEQDYSVESTTTSTKMQMMQHDIPQSVGIVNQQRMEDQQLQTLGDVMDNTLGVNKGQADLGHSSYYPCESQIDSYMVDGIPIYFELRQNLGDALSDTAFFERAEVVHDTNGLVTGTGNPSASIGMIRKHATSHELAGSVSVEYSSWSKQCYVTDLQSPPTADGSVYGRVVTGYQNNDSRLDRYNSGRMFFSGIVDADSGDTISLFAGYEYQRIDINSPAWGGLSRWNTDGSKNSCGHSRSTASDWAYNDKNFSKVLVIIKQRFADTWRAITNATHSRVKFDSKMTYIDAYVNKADGTLIGPYGNYGPGYGYVGGTGSNNNRRRVNAADLFVDGGYDLFGRQHNLMLGGSYSKQNNRYENSWANAFLSEIDSFYTYDGNFPEASRNLQLSARDSTTYMKSLYVATRIPLTDPLHLVADTRYTNWCINTLIYSMKQDHTMPYVDPVYNVDDNRFTCASHTSIFQPQNKYDGFGKHLPPITGNNYELGLKFNWINSYLATTLTAFHTEQDNVVRSTGMPIAGSNGDMTFKAMDGAVSKGVKFEISGAITDNWQTTLNATRYVAEDNGGDAVNPSLPRTTVKLFTRYRLPVMPELTAGSRVNWQNRVYSDTVTPYGTFHAEQGSYALVDSLTRYRIIKNFLVQGNPNNLSDKTYDTSINGSIVHGKPCNVSITASYQS